MKILSRALFVFGLFFVFYTQAFTQSEVLTSIASASAVIYGKPSISHTEFVGFYTAITAGIKEHIYVSNFGYILVILGWAGEIMLSRKNEKKNGA